MSTNSMINHMNWMINQGNKRLGFLFLKAVTRSKIVQTIIRTYKMIDIVTFVLIYLVVATFALILGRLR